MSQKVVSVHLDGTFSLWEAFWSLSLSRPYKQYYKSVTFIIHSAVIHSLWIAHMTTDHLWWRSRGSLLCNRTGFYGYATLAFIRLWKRVASWGADEWGHISPTESVVQVQRINFVVIGHAWTHKKYCKLNWRHIFSSLHICTCVLLWCSCSPAGFK